MALAGLLGVALGCAHAGRTRAECRDVCNERHPGEGWRQSWGGPVFPTQRWQNCMDRCRG